MGDAGDVIVKRMTFPDGPITTSAGGLIVTATISDSTVQSSPASEWASFAARYQQYRVRAMRLIAKACFPVNTSTITHGSLFLADYIGSSGPTTPAQVLSDERGKVVDTYKDFVYEVDWSRNPNAKLWNPTSAVIPVANTFGIAYASQATPVLAAAANYFSATLEWLVEFRGSQ